MNKENILGVNVSVTSYNELKKYIEEDIKNNKKSFIVAINPEKILKAREDEKLKDLLKKIGIEEFTTHQLRHTYATRSIEAGMSPVVLQKLMGHTDVSVTLNAYTSVFDKYKKDELEKVNDYIIEQNLIKLPESSPLNLEEHNPILIDNFKENNYEQER